jgi:flagellar hook-basal body complex protein FliE
MNIPAIGIGPLGASEWSVGGLGTSIPSAASTTGGGSSDSGSFGSALSGAISSLENTQATATTDAQQVATGQSTDPTQAITAVENASLSMDFASQIRNQLDTAATTLFETQL